MAIYNVEPDVVDIKITEGDSVSLAFSVTKNDVAYVMTGMQLDMDIYRGSTLYRSLSSAGVSPALVIATSNYTITTTAFVAGIYKYDLQVTDGTTIMTVQKGTIIVEGDVTE